MVSLSKRASSSYRRHALPPKRVKLAQYSCNSRTILVQYSYAASTSPPLPFGVVYLDDDTASGPTTKLHDRYQSCRLAAFATLPQRRRVKRRVSLCVNNALVRHVISRLQLTSYVCRFIKRNILYLSRLPVSLCVGPAARRSSGRTRKISCSCPLCG